MLEKLYVKNFILIDEIEVDFKDGLNVLLLYKSLNISYS